MLSVVYPYLTSNVYSENCSYCLCHLHNHVLTWSSTVHMCLSLQIVPVKNINWQEVLKLQ